MERAFQEAIREERRKARLSQEKLAKRAGMKRTRVGAIERGERGLSEEEFVKLCIALEANLATILARIHRSLSISLHGLEAELRLQMGKEAPAEESEAMPEEVTKAVDAFFEHGKKLVLLVLESRGKGSPGDFPLTPFPRIPEWAGEGPPRTRPGKPRKQPSRRSKSDSSAR